LNILDRQPVEADNIHLLPVQQPTETKVMLSRGFLCATLFLSVSTSQAWIGPKPFAARSTPTVEQYEPSTVPPLKETGRQIFTLGFGCFLAAATVFASPAFADAGKFSYDPNLGGPENWSALQVEGNQCSGSKQSPIAIKPTGCNIGANYQFTVCFYCGERLSAAVFPK